MFAITKLLSSLNAHNLDLLLVVNTGSGGTDVILNFGFQAEQKYQRVGRDECVGGRLTRQSTVVIKNIEK